jgi:hypothetical protein
MPLSIVQIRAKVADKKMPKGVRLFYNQDWYNTQAFAHQSQLEWRLIKKTPVDDSTLKTWTQQQELLDAKVEETPTAQAVVYTVIAHYLETDERLLEKIYVRCSDLDSGGFRVCVGRFGTDGLIFNYISDDSVGSGLGLSASRKLEES